MVLASQYRDAKVVSNADVAQLVERDLAKVEVAGSSPVVRSSKSLISVLDHRVCAVCHDRSDERSSVF